MNSNLCFAVPSRHFWLGSVVVALVAALGCNSEPQAITSQNSKYEVADNSAANGAEKTSSEDVNSQSGMQEGNNPAAAANGSGQDETPPVKPSSAPPPSVNRQAGNQDGRPVRPESNDPDELLAYVDQLAAIQPRDTTRDSMARFEQTMREIVEVTDQILGQDAKDEAKLSAAQSKIRAQTILSSLGNPQAAQDLKIFLSDLEKNKNPQLAQLGKRMAFAQKMDAFGSGETTNTEPLMKDFRDLFKGEDKDTSLFVLGRQVASLFMQSGKEKEAVEVMKLTYERFKDSEDEQVAEAAKSFGEQIKLVELNMNEKLSNYLSDVPDSEKALFEALDQLFASKDLGPTSLQISLQIAQILETKDVNAAARIYDQIKGTFGNYPDKDLKEMVTASVENFSKRKELIGKPFEVEGVTMDGAPFDWAQYRGKIVLVDFWATWCRPCLQEMPNIRRNYEKYRDQGFEVVGVNIDEDPEALNRFFSIQQIPWTTVRTSDPNKNGFDHPLLVKSGADAIPFIVLVDREGIAIALNVRGEQLGKKLEELIGAPGEAPAKPAAGQAKEKTSSYRPSSSAVSSAFVGIGADEVESAGSDDAELAVKKNDQ